MSNSVFSCSHLSNQIGDPLATLTWQMQDKQQGEEDERVCKIAGCAKSERFDSPSVFHDAKFKLHSAKHGECRSELLKFGFFKHWETSREGFEREQRVIFSSVAHRSGHGHRHWETSCKTELASHRNLVHHNIFYIATKSIVYGKIFGNARQKLGVPRTTIYTNKPTWGIFMTTCMWAAVHIDMNQEENLRVARNTEFSEFWPHSQFRKTVCTVCVIRRYSE